MKHNKTRNILQSLAIILQFELLTDREEQAENIDVNTHSDDSKTQGEVLYFGIFKFVLWNETTWWTNKEILIDCLMGFYRFPQKQQDGNDHLKQNLTKSLSDVW